MGVGSGRFGIRASGNSGTGPCRMCTLTPSHCHCEPFHGAAPLKIKETVIASSCMAAAATQNGRTCHREERAPFASDEAIPTFVNVGDCFVAKGRLLAMTSFSVGPPFGPKQSPPRFTLGIASPPKAGAARNDGFLSSEWRASAMDELAMTGPYILSGGLRLGRLAVTDSANSPTWADASA